MQRPLALFVLAFLAAPTAAGVVEDFEHGTKSLYTATSGIDTLTLVGGAAHDGNLGARFTGSGGPSWWYRTDVTTQPGETYRCFIRVNGSGRTYVGVAASAGGCISMVAAPNTGNIILMDNVSYGYSDLATAAVSWQFGVWYQLELQWDANGDMTVRLYDESGATKIAETATVATGYLSPGGFAMRGFYSGGDMDLDTFGTAQSLEGSPGSISLSSGGAQVLSMDAGSSFALDTYLILGSVSGTFPGLPWGSSVVPLNFDPYLVFTLLNPNTPLLNGNAGTLNSLGQATAVFSLPAGSDPALAGLIVNHAGLILDPTIPGIGLKLVTEAVPCTLTP